MDEQIILNRVLGIKEKLIQLQSFYINSDPVQEFDRVKIASVNLAAVDMLFDYPIEYKFFLEHIGTVYIAYAGAFMLEVCLPCELEDCWWISDQEIIESNNYRIIAFTDNDEIFDLIFDISKKPFERYCTSEEISKMNFLEIVELKVNELLNN